MTSIFIIVAALFALSPAHARGPIGEFVHISTGLEPLDKQIGYGETRIESVATTYQDRAYQAVDRRFHGGLSDGNRWVVAPDVKVRETLSDVRIPTKDRTLPSMLYDARLKFHYKTGGDAAGAGVLYDVGQATDQLFKSTNDVAYSVTPYISFGPEKRSRFVTFINVSNDRPLLNNIPIPGFSLGTRLSPYWGVSLGFPHTGLWAKLSWMEIEVSVEPLLHLDARLTFIAGNLFDFYFSAVSSQETYRRGGRASYNEQIIYSGQTVSAGLSKKAGPLLLELSGGLGMNRNYVETSDYLNDRKAGLLRIANGVVAQARFKIGF